MDSGLLVEPPPALRLFNIFFIIIVPLLFTMNLVSHMFNQKSSVDSSSDYIQVN